MKKSILISFSIIYVQYIIAQNRTELKYPELGKVMPEFLLKHMNYFNKTEATLADFSGKWLVLDFWNRFCSGCIGSFPKINEEIKAFNDKVQFVLIGYEDPENGAQKTYEKYREREHLEIPCAFDSAICQRFHIAGVPYIIVIDPAGIVRGITNNLTEENINDFISGKAVELARAYREDETPKKVKYNPSVPYLVNGNGSTNDSDFIFRSILTRYNDSIATYFPKRITNVTGNRFEILGANIVMLYRFAFFGQDYWRNNDSMYGLYNREAELHVKEPFLFKESSAIRYCYSLIVPYSKASPDYLMRVMQSDLHNYFGFDVKIESRKLPYWRLVISDERKLQRHINDDPEYSKKTGEYGLLKNMSIKSLIYELASRYYDMPFIDGTGLTSMVKLTFNDWWFVFDDIKNALGNIGLDLVRCKREMKVLVINDSVN